MWNWLFSKNKRKSKVKDKTRDKRKARDKTVPSRPAQAAAPGGLNRQYSDQQLEQLKRLVRDNPKLTAQVLLEWLKPKKNKKNKNKKNKEKKGKEKRKR